MIRMRFVSPTGQLFSQMPEKLQNALVDGMEDALLLIERVVQAKYLRGPKPGRLEMDSTLLSHSILKMATRSNVPGEFARGRIGTNVFYGKIHEQEGFRGTGFYIYAKKPTGMHFFWKQRGYWVHGAKRVMIPARPFLYPAIIESLNDVKLLLQAIIIRTLRGKP